MKGITMAVAALAAAAIVGGADTAVGRYQLTGVREVGSELLLKPDGTFDFALIYGAADYSSKGSWKRDGESVVLNTSGAPQEPFRLIHSAKTAQNHVRIIIKGRNGRPVPNIDVSLATDRGEVQARTDEQGVAAFPPCTVRSATISVRVYQVEAGPYALDPKNNEFQFEINGEAIMQVRFENERLRKVGDALELRHFSPSKPMTYRRQGAGE